MTAVTGDEDGRLQSFCLYCQRDYGTFRRLLAHVLRMHPDTYAAHSLQEKQR